MRFAGMVGAGLALGFAFLLGLGIGAGALGVPMVFVPAHAFEGGTFERAIGSLRSAAPAAAPA